VAEVKLACDAMLGSLARWLRLAGLDSSYGPDFDDAELARCAAAAGRWLLTRDRILAAGSGPRVVLLRETAVLVQLREVVERLDLTLDESRFFTRCSLCNGELADVSAESVAELVPTYVASHQARFARCVVCDKVYWPGTHHTRILGQLRTALGQRPATEP
jgi:uncharacterized protein with PIN domain